MQLRNTIYNRQSQSAAATFLSGRAEKAFTQALQVFGSNAVAGVGDDDSVSSQCYVNGAVFRAVADGVVEQIADKDGKQGMVTG
ncbi:hypothetical protein BGI33_12670 [Snodgrassella alvi]|uniref:Uncharacterized protein n=1 Tax=Snodgrassella alvi TaxID=1196083 RepID=A0A2N9WU39_9NEIS|nr:hypothetical protein [Snodgrassella alvi]PIT12786.1 hypothetical protein BGI33_12670 [Snodgrassella alvi]PIT15504.1 hypothetical protein BGI34_12855 [Snodgrassella alvi]PIT15520.1 hypothetical protein BGI32_05520 [Snodgrassella alvi]